MSMNGIDISNHQNGINLTKVPCDFVIMKATQGNSYVNPDFTRTWNQAKNAGKCLGIYHYATGVGVEAEVNFFLQTIGNRIGDAILCLDWENSESSSGRNTQFSNIQYAKQWLDLLYSRTGVRGFIYMSKSVCRQFDWSSVANTYKLWGAQYPNYNKTGYQSNPWTDNKGWGAWDSPTIFQYSSSGSLSGYNGNLDLDLSYIDKTEWLKNAKGTSTTTTTKPTEDAKKSITEIAKEVLAGNGEMVMIERKSSKPQDIAIL